MRGRWAGLALVLLALGAAAVVVVVAGDESGGDSFEVALPQPGKRFGFAGQAFMLTGRYPQLDIGVTPERAAADALAAGANAARVEVSWRDAEPQPGRFEPAVLDRIDRFVRALERGGGRVLLLINAAPAWAAALPDQPGSPPRDDAQARAAYARFAAICVQRWRRALGVEIWNEPNYAVAWRPRPDAAAYGRLLRVASRAVRRARPGALVISGGLADGESGEIEPAERFFSAARITPAVADGAALHLYPPNDRNGDVELDEGGLRDFIERARMPLWITETGLSTGGDNGVSPQAQARGVAESASRLSATRGVEGVFVHTQHEPRGVGPAERGYGLSVSRGDLPAAPKPAFCKLRDLAARPRRFPACTTNGANAMPMRIQGVSESRLSK